MLLNHTTTVDIETVEHPGYRTCSQIVLDLMVLLVQHQQVIYGLFGWTRTNNYPYYYVE